MNVSRDYFIANMHVQTIYIRKSTMQLFYPIHFCRLMVISRVNWTPCSFIHYDENCFFISNNYTFPAFIIFMRMYLQAHTYNKQTLNVHNNNNRNNNMKKLGQSYSTIKVIFFSYKNIYKTICRLV